jgi:hypothetical protein
MMNTGLIGHLCWWSHSESWRKHSCWRVCDNQWSAWMIPDVSKSLVYEIMKERLDYQKYCLKIKEELNWRSANFSCALLSGSWWVPWLHSDGMKCDCFTTHLSANNSWWKDVTLILSRKINSEHQKQENHGNCFLGPKGGLSGWFYVTWDHHKHCSMLWTTEKAWT